jgi:hypothetical protein
MLELSNPEQFRVSDCSPWIKGLVTNMEGDGSTTRQKFCRVVRFWLLKKIGVRVVIQKVTAH